MLKKDDKSQQLVYYQAGIGTYTIPEIATPFVAKWKKTIDMAIASYLDAHVMGGYEFLMEQYHAEDKICIFGFSRGAYTARALAGMIHKVGLLPAGNHQQVPFAYKMFSRNDQTGWDQSTQFKKAFSIDVEIEFVGVWDTVASVGLIPHTLPFTHSNTAIRYFRHAMSLDERRAKFKANHYHLRHDHEQKGTRIGEMPRSNSRNPHFHSSHDHDRKGDKPKKTTDVREVWFAGCHCDVGGGSVENGTRNSLARIPLRWMIRECFRVNSGIQFYRETFKDIGLDPATFDSDSFRDPRPPPITPTPELVAQTVAAAKAAADDAKAAEKAAKKADAKVTCHDHEPSDGTLVAYVQASPTAASSFKSEEDEEFADALSDKYDQLELSKPWWILELLPMRHREQNRKDYSLNYEWKVNLGEGRKVPEPDSEKEEKVLVHRSVKIRMDAMGLPQGEYKPKADFLRFDHEWVD